MRSALVVFVVSWDVGLRVELGWEGAAIPLPHPRVNQPRWASFWPISCVLWLERPLSHLVLLILWLKKNLMATKSEFLRVLKSGCMRKLKAKFWEGEQRLSVLRESVWNWNTDWNDTHCKQMWKAGHCSFKHGEGKHRVKAGEMLLTGYVKHAETRVSCYWKWGSSPMLECCSCSPTPISLPLSLFSNRSLHHLLGLCLTPSVMVHFT